MIGISPFITYYFGLTHHYHKVIPSITFHCIIAILCNNTVNCRVTLYCHITLNYPTPEQREIRRWVFLISIFLIFFVIITWTMGPETLEQDTAGSSRHRASPWMPANRPATEISVVRSRLALSRHKDVDEKKLNKIKLEINREEDDEDAMPMNEPEVELIIVGLEERSRCVCINIYLYIYICTWASRAPHSSRENDEPIRNTIWPQLCKGSRGTR